MQLLNKTTAIYGFEDYKIINIYDGCFYHTYEFYMPYDYETNTWTYVINKDLPVKVKGTTRGYRCDDLSFEPEICIDHKELLSTAKKVYTHPCCKLSRSMMAEKYKRSLNPYLSDAVVIPKPNYNELNLGEYALFINEGSKIIVKVFLCSEKATAQVEKFEYGAKFGDMVTCQISNSCGTLIKNVQPAMMEAEYFYRGQLLIIPNTHRYVLDLLTNKIPADKTVYESSVQESLGSSDNKITLENLTSIYEMIESSDENTVSAGLKALSMLDWHHYANSVKYILQKSSRYKWVYNKAMSSTSVKFMFKSLCPYARSRNYYPGKYSEDIYEEDWELIKQFIMHYDKVDSDNVLEYLRFYSFMKVNSEGVIVPHLKNR